jgi:hypothetical protein
MVLLAGGGGLASTELYDPATQTFTATGALNAQRLLHTATLLTGGAVLLAGGESFVPTAALSSADLYPPSALTPAIPQPPNLIRIDITPASPTVAVGSTLQLSAIGTFADNSTQQLAAAIWSVSDTSMAQITNDATNRGTVLGLKPGVVTITATAGGVIGSSIFTTY